MPFVAELYTPEDAVVGKMPPSCILKAKRPRSDDDRELSPLEAYLLGEEGDDDDESLVLFPRAPRTTLLHQTSGGPSALVKRSSPCGSCASESASAAHLFAESCRVQSPAVVNGIGLTGPDHHYQKLHRQGASTSGSQLLRFVPCVSLADHVAILAELHAADVDSFSADATTANRRRSSFGTTPPLSCASVRGANPLRSLHIPPPSSRVPPTVCGWIADDSLSMILKALGGPYRNLLVVAMMCMRKVLSYPDESRLAALALLARFIEARPQDLAGPKSRSCVVAGVISLALKFAVHDVSISSLVSECGLAAEANVRVSDVVDAELRILGACTVGVRVPAIWTLSAAILDLVALSLPQGPPGHYPPAAAFPQSAAATLGLSSLRHHDRHRRATCLAYTSMITVALERVLLSKNAEQLLGNSLFPLALPVACGLLTAEDAAALLSVQAGHVQAAAQNVNDALLFHQPSSL